MSSFEIGYCGLEEYQAGEPSRVMASSLCIEGLYTVMFRINAGNGKDAAKYPSKITDIDETQTGIHVVNFNILNADLGPTLDTYGTFINGYWHKVAAPGINIGENPVITGYFKESYQDSNGEKELQAMIKNSRAIVLHEPRPQERFTL